MTIQDLEDAIVAKVDSQLAATGIPAEPFPERPAEYRMTHPIGKALVIFSGCSNGLEVTSEPTSYERTSTFSISLMLRGLRSPQGVYAVLETMLQALDAWTPPGCRRARTARVAFQGNDQGVWVYELTFEATDLVVRPLSSWS